MKMKGNIIGALALAACLAWAPVAGASAQTTTKTTKKTTSSKKTTATKLATVVKAVAAADTASKVAQAVQKADKLGSTVKSAAAQKSSGGSVLGSVLGGVLGSSKTDSSASSTASSATGGSVLGSVLGGVLGGSQSSSGSTGSGVLSALSTIFDLSKIASGTDLVGTWTYTEPAVVFSSDNALKNVGGKMVSGAIESKLQEQFEKFGLKKGAMQMTFDKDGNFTQTIGGRTLKGTYTLSGQSVELKYAGQMQQIVGTTQVDGKDLLIVMDASKLLKYANVLGSLTGNSILSTAGNLLGSMDGMEVGLKLNK